MRKLFSALAIVVLLVAAIAVAGAWKYQQLLSSLNIDQLDVDVNELGWRHARFSKITFTYQTETSNDHVDLRGVVLDWEWRSWFSPALVSATLERAHIERFDSGLTSANAEPFTLPTQWNLPDFFPQQFAVEQLFFSLPCPAGRCAMAGKMSTTFVDNALTFSALISPATLPDATKGIQISGHYTLDENLPRLNMVLAVEDDVKLELEAQLLLQDAQRYWAGNINGVTRYPNAWIRAALDEWKIHLSDEWARSVNNPITVNSEWHLAVQPLMDFKLTNWRAALDGRLSLDANLAEPLAIQDLGEFSGNVFLNMKAIKGQLDLFEFSTDITANNTAMPPYLIELGIDVDSVKITASSLNETDFTISRVPIHFIAQSEGAVSGNVVAEMIVNIPEKSITFEDSTIKLIAKALTPASGYTFTNASIDLSAKGSFSNDELSFDVVAPSVVRADIDVQPWSMSASGTEIKTDRFDFHVALVDNVFDWSSAHLATTADISIVQLQQPLVLKSSWQWSGDLQGSLPALTVKGTLIANRSLTIKHDVLYKPPMLTAKWQVSDVFLLAGNPVADLLPSWPPLLSLSKGKLSGEGDIRFDLDKNALKKSTALVRINDVAGIYDTTLFQGLTGVLKATVAQDDLTLVTDELVVKQVDKGLTAGPLKAAGAYTATWDQLTSGTLKLEKFTGNMMGGAIGVAAQTFDFSQEQQSFTVTLDRIDLDTLLQQHPTTELSGSGRISGDIPLSITADGILVNKGLVSALPPGGELKYQSDKATALAKNQPGVKLITDALNDFHYSVLSSEVNYDESGKLLLSVKLEGKNPNLENGRPIHFTINLEENIPAMIASLQLSNQISDVVKKRIQQKLQKKAEKK